MPRDLSIVVMGPDHARVHGALSLAVGGAALGGRVRLFFQGEAVKALAQAKCWPENDALRDIGAATLPELRAQAAELEIEIFACETGMHLTGVRADGLVAGVETAGLIGFLAGRGEADEMVTV